MGLITMPLHWLPFRLTYNGEPRFCHLWRSMTKRPPSQHQNAPNNSEQMAFFWRLCSVVRLWRTHLAHTFEYPKASIIAIALPLLTESCTANCRLVMCRFIWIMPLVHCNMSGLLAVAGCPDHGRSCISVSPLPEALTLWTQHPTVLLFTAQLPYTAHNRCECSP